MTSTVYKNKKQAIEFIKNILNLAEPEEIAEIIKTVTYERCSYNEQTELFEIELEE